MATKLNKLTVSCGLNLNASNFKKWIIGYIKSISSEADIPKLKKSSYVALTVMNEELCVYIIKEVLKNIKADHTGMFIIDSDTIQTSISHNDELNRFLRNILLDYNGNIPFENTYCIPKQIAVDFINTFTKNLMLKNNAYNVLAYILTYCSSYITRIAFTFMKYSNKKTLDCEAIKCALDCFVYFNNEMCKVLKDRIDVIVSSIPKEETAEEAEINGETIGETNGETTGKTNEDGTNPDTSGELLADGETDPNQASQKKKAKGKAKAKPKATPKPKAKKSDTPTDGQAKPKAKPKRKATGVVIADPNETEPAQVPPHTPVLSPVDSMLPPSLGDSNVLNPNIQEPEQSGETTEEEEEETEEADENDETD